MSKISPHTDQKYSLYLVILMDSELIEFIHTNCNVFSVRIGSELNLQISSEKCAEFRLFRSHAEQRQQNIKRELFVLY